MNYFKYFPVVDYKFGNESNPDRFENISAYATVIDELKNNVAFYRDYTIQEFERPDQLSYKIYGNEGFHWTFFMLNNNIRERGWPITNSEIIEKAVSSYPYTTLTTRTQITSLNPSLTRDSIFQPGRTVSGNISGATGTIDHRHLDLGQIVIKNKVGTFVDGESVSSVAENGDVQTIVLESSSIEYNAAHHYENAAGETVDIDPTVGPSAFLVEITYLDRLVRQNEELKQIKVIKPSAINQVVASFREAIRS